MAGIVLLIIVSCQERVYQEDIESPQNSSEESEIIRGDFLLPEENKLYM